MSAELPPPPGPPPPSRPDTEPRVPWGPLDSLPVFLLAIGLTFVGGAPAALLLSSSGARFVAAALVGELGFLGAVLVWLRWVRRVPLSALGASRDPLRDLGMGLLSGVGLVGVGVVAGYVVVVAARLILGHPPVQPEQIPSGVHGTNLVLSGIVVVLAAPLGEEVFFRGFLFQGLRRRLSLWPAALISAAVFAVVHGYPVLIFALFPIGVGLALIFEWRKSLLASMAAHAVFNLVGILVIAAR